MCLRDVVVFAIPGWGDAHYGVHTHPSSSEKEKHKLHLLKIMNKNCEFDIPWPGPGQVGPVCAGTPTLEMQVRNKAQLLQDSPLCSSTASKPINIVRCNIYRLVPYIAMLTEKA
jgi:hypothetical protein